MEGLTIFNRVAKGKYLYRRCRKMLFVLVLFGFLFILSQSAQAHESIFAWTYTTDLLPKGKWEFEQWATSRLQKEHGTYQAFDFREEIEYGLLDNLGVSIYLNHHYAKAKNSFPEEDPNNPGHRLSGSYVTGGEDVHPGHDPSQSFETYHFESVSTELIYRILSPYKDPIGLALYMEPTIGNDETELEWKILLHKTWLDDQLVWAMNLNYGLAFEEEAGGEFGRDAMTEVFTGLSYRFIPNWSAGMELWNHHEYADASDHEHSAWFVGPTLHYGGKSWWATLGLLRQLPIGQAFNEDQKEFAEHDGYIFGEEHEKYYVRMKMGFNF